MNVQNPIDWPRLAKLIHAHRRFTLTSHVKPDCDALGSEVGLAAVLESLGKQVAIVNADPVPPHLRFIDPEQRIKQLGIDISAESAVDCDALIVADTSAWIQLGAMGDVLRKTRGTRLVLDHHVSEDDLGAEYFKNPQAEATGRLVVELADELDVSLTPRIAAPLFTAIATDTGWFRFSSVTGDTFRTIGRLIDACAKPAVIYNALYERHTLARVQLMGRILARTTSELEGRLIHTVALQQDFVETGALPGDTEDLVNTTLAVAGTQVAVFFSEQPNGSFKVSFRSRCEVDCAKVAEQFGGGGHRAAAGATVTGDWPIVRAKVLDGVRAAMT
ncbi:MAG: bifunctional oligoribonuclease/PAP phosphatase NrnA [Pirellulales bacterium]